MLITSPSLNLSWSCPTCKYTLPTLLRLNSTVTEIKTANDERLMKLELEMAEMDLKIDDKVEENLDEKIDDMKKQIQELLSTDMNSIIDARIKEIDDRKQHCHNLMLYNLPESNYDNPEQRKHSAIVLTCELAGHLRVKLNSIKGFRIGKRDRYRQNSAI